jgi:hypothetical protein
MVAQASWVAPSEDQQPEHEGSAGLELVTRQGRRSGRIAGRDVVGGAPFGR